MRGRFRHAQRIAMEAIDAAARRGDGEGESRAWKLFGLLSVMLLHKTQSSGFIERRDLEDRADAFARGKLLPLLESAKQAAREASLC